MGSIRPIHASGPRHAWLQHAGLAGWLAAAASLNPNLFFTGLLAAAKHASARPLSAPPPPPHGRNQSACHASTSTHSRSLSAASMTKMMASASA